MFSLYLCTQCEIAQFTDKNKCVHQIRTLFRERVTVKWNNDVKIRQANLRREECAVKHTVSPGNTISIRVDENTKLIDDNEEEKEEEEEEEEGYVYE